MMLGWRQEEKGMAEDEMVEWHHWFNGHELEQTLGYGEVQGSSSPQDQNESDITGQLNNNKIIFKDVVSPSQRKEQIFLPPWKKEIVFPSGTVANNYIVQYYRVGFHRLMDPLSYNTTFCMADATCFISMGLWELWLKLSSFRLPLHNTINEVS